MGDLLRGSEEWPGPDGHDVSTAVTNFVWLEYPIERWLLTTDARQVFHYDPVERTTTLIGTLYYLN